MYNVPAPVSHQLWWSTTLFQLPCVNSRTSDFHRAHSSNSSGCNRNKDCGQGTLLLPRDEVRTSDSRPHASVNLVLNIVIESKGLGTSKSIHIHFSMPRSAPATVFGPTRLVFTGCCCRNEKVSRDEHVQRHACNR